MSSDRSQFTGKRGVPTPYDKDPTADPHRKTCRYKKGGGWGSDVDFAVYHAPGWKSWQAFRQKLLGMSVDEKVKELKGWPVKNKWDVVRVLNYTVSQRNVWKTHPAMAELSKQLREKYNDMKGTSNGD